MMIVVPTRSRPHNVEPFVQAFHDTDAFADGAMITFVIDDDDPQYQGYFDAFARVGAVLTPGRSPVAAIVASSYEPLVPKLNKSAEYARIASGSPALGFMGDDHRPRTPHWAAEYLSALRLAGTGIVSCPDGYRTDDLPTQWVMSADIVEAFRGMVPAPVDHLYCDDVIRDIAKGSDCYTFREDLLIEHVHPVAGKATEDEQYRRVNSREQYQHDWPRYRDWKRNGGLDRDAMTVRMLREEG